MSSQVTESMKADARRLGHAVAGLKVRDLVAICTNLPLSKTGPKAELQKRILEYVQNAAQGSSVVHFNSIKRIIFDIAYPGSSQHPATSEPATSSPSSNIKMAPWQINHAYGGQSWDRSQPLAALRFRPSPFYDTTTLLGPVKTLEVMSQHKSSITVYLKASMWPDLSSDPTQRVMVFCATGNSGTQDITFPHQSEIKLNGDEVKANLRGLKGKAGSTRPVDITDYLRLKPSSYTNNLDFTYALTKQESTQASEARFYLAVYLCKTHPIPELVATIQRRNRISKNSVILELTKNAQDPDIVATAQTWSLKCPLSYMRLDVPVRAMSCKHTQCFDATSYLQLQEQGPQWLCPICNQSAPFENLAVDEYVKDILANTSKSQDQVTIEPDGQWHANSDAANTVAHDNDEASYLDDDDLAVIISEVGHSGGRSTATPNRSFQTLGTPVTDASREGSSLPKPPNSNKRPIAQVIDLTLSDSDDEPFTRPAKRSRPEHFPSLFGFGS